MIRIEVTGDSLPEVADKLLALGRSLTVTASYEADNAAREAMQAERDAAPKAKPTRKAKEVEQKADAPEPEVAEEQSAPAEPAAQTSSAKDAPSEAVEPTLDFDKDVAPVVLDAVAAIGKEKVIGLIGEFGAARASEVDPAQWPELVALLKDSM